MVFVRMQKTHFYCVNTDKISQLCHVCGILFFINEEENKRVELSNLINKKINGLCCSKEDIIIVNILLF